MQTLFWLYLINSISSKKATGNLPRLSHGWSWRQHSSHLFFKGDSPSICCSLNYWIWVLEFYLQPFKLRLISLAGRTTQQEIRWHLAQILPRVKLGPDEKKEIEKYLFLYLNDPSKIVVTFALQALTDFALENIKLQPRMIRVLQEFIHSGSPAIKNRSRKLLKQLKK